jgi:putative oxidoreductase
MVVAILSVHLGNGLFMSNNGYEFGLALLAGSVALALLGGGRWSLDRVLATGRPQAAGRTVAAHG